MAYWVVRDGDNKEHVVWADQDKYEALQSIPGAKSVRTPTGNDLKKVASDEPHNPRGAEEEVFPSDNQ